MRFGPDDPEADPRLPEIYDAECVWGPDDDFYLALAAQQPARRIVDLGCGTGRLTIALAAAGHRVTGIDPNPSMLRRAQAKPGAELVTWIHGTSASIDAEAFDLALMTSHVAQVFVDDAEWGSVLADLRRGLVPGGVLTFESRDPRARGWERWTKDASHAVVELDDGRAVETWVDVTAVDADVATYSWVNVFPDGDVLQGADSLRFRSEAELRSSLADAGFEIRALFGGWHGEPVGPGTGELVVVARASPNGPSTR